MIPTLNRRRFLEFSTAGTMSFVIGCDTEGNVGPVLTEDAGATDTGESGDTASPPRAVSYSLVTWVRINEDNTATIAMQKAEMGQGVHTALPLLVAEELDISAEQIRVEVVPEIAPYTLGGGLPMTYGSTSVRESYLPFRKVGATARAMLVAAAATQWGISTDEIQTASGECIAPNGERLPYSALAEAASTLEPPEAPTLKEESAFQLIGVDQERFMDRAIVEGTAEFGIDAAPPDGLYAAIRHAPTPGGAPLNVADLRVDNPGVHQIVSLPNAVAVVADSFWTAKTVVEALEVEFSTPEADLLIDSDALKAELLAGLDTTGLEVLHDGDVDVATAAASHTWTADYYAPHIAHAPLEPVNATAHVTDTSCELWLPTQGPGFVRSKAMELTGLPAEAITLHSMLLGGGYGRKIDQDYPEAAIRIAQAVDKPVTLIWSREEDIRRDQFRPSFMGRLSGALDAEGRLTAFDVANSGDSVLGFGQADPLSVQGISEIAYEVPNQRIRHVYLPSPIEAGFWRSIGHSQNTFFVESFLDEMAHLGDRDPLEFRLEMLQNKARARHVLERVATLSSWGNPVVPGAQQGLAMCTDYGSFVAVVCEASVDPETKAITIHRYDAVADCGVIVQPTGVRAQLEGGLLFGLSAALHEEVRFEEGRTLSSNFTDYPILRPSESPDIQIELVESSEAPGGAGELSVGAAGPALANAIFRASGVRCRFMPLKRCLAESA